MLTLFLAFHLASILTFFQFFLASILALYLVSYFGILSGIYSDIYSGICSAILSDVIDMGTARPQPQAPDLSGQFPLRSAVIPENENSHLRPAEI